MPQCFWLGLRDAFRSPSLQFSEQIESQCRFRIVCRMIHDGNVEWQLRFTVLQW
jgi:hypothetical protein